MFIALGPLCVFVPLRAIDREETSDPPCCQMAMEVATGQGRGLMMNMFMMWMAGNSLHIFPIMMVSSLCYSVEITRTG